MTGALWIGLLLLLGSLLLETYAPEKLKEGFAAVAGGAKPVSDGNPNSLIAQQFPRRGDVTYRKEAEAYYQDGRYFADYTDVQRIGIKNDFCRMVVPKGGDTAAMFFACALAGSKNLTTVGYKSRTVRDGFRVGRDDYMRDLYKDGRNSYCRILKGDDGQYEPLCIRATDTGFDKKDVVDPDPPEDVLTMLDFYRGAVAWFRFYDDMLDYIENTFIQRAGGLKIEEYPPRPTVTRGLTFNGLDQFLRIGDNTDLTLGTKLNIRQIRAISLWVRFDKFTNNAHIFDFGNGAGHDNFFLGILGAGDPDSSNAAELRATADCGADKVLPVGPSGAQPVPEVTPQALMLSTQGNLDCPYPEVTPRRLPPSTIEEPTQFGPRSRATLLYEVWDKRLRKMQIKINRAIPLGKWTHICITAKTADALRPDITVWINGEQVFVEPSGFLPQPLSTSHNYIGKSNWANDASQYELRDELFAGSIFDFRMYESVMTNSKIARTIEWGRRKLGLA
jgi:Concanavalin A-like lectin/glucanases superfamily